jgi:hypothetical protein
MLPRDRRLYRVVWHYLTEGGEWKRTQSVLLTEPEAQRQAAELLTLRPVPRADLRPVVLADVKATADYFADQELRKSNTKGK